MIDQKKDLLSADETGADEQGSTPRPHEPPRITRLGTVAELTLGHPVTHETDGTFPGSLFT
ncbi:MAG TPA: lasso RiPP family leader peptide-containing protein [Solirubrobacteraceae bacterium]|jgi:hypothetical protein|nr:lasso RiPP family leader peptide-containing protein [Solirubrobacteraceae bacterium]